jgi:hypothetical protein
MKKTWDYQIEVIKLSGEEGGAQPPGPSDFRQAWEQETTRGEKRDLFSKYPAFRGQVTSFYPSVTLCVLCGATSADFTTESTELHGGF